MLSWLKDRLVDDLEQAYVEWRTQSRRVSLAYTRWSTAPPRDGGMRYAAYLEELDREQRACELYAETIGLVAQTG